MSKILTDHELAKIVDSIIDGTEGFDCCYQQLEFVDGLAKLLAKHCGGSIGVTEYTDELDTYTTVINVNDDVPTDGGIWKDYDTDVTWSDGKEV